MTEFLEALGFSNRQQLNVLLQPLDPAIRSRLTDQPSPALQLQSSIMELAKMTFVGTLSGHPLIVVIDQALKMTKSLPNNPHRDGLRRWRRDRNDQLLHGETYRRIDLNALGAQRDTQATPPIQQAGVGAPTESTWSPESTQVTIQGQRVAPDHVDTAFVHLAPVTSIPKDRALILSLHRMWHAFTRGGYPVLHILTGVNARGEVDLPTTEKILGRGATAQVQITDISISREHAKIVYDQGHWFVEDMGSRNGTFVRGKKITQRVRLELGDSLGLGSFHFKFDKSANEPSLVGPILLILVGIVIGAVATLIAGSSAG